MSSGQEPSDSVGAPGGLRVIKVTTGWAMGEVDRCLIMVHRGQPDLAMLQFRAAELEGLSRRHPGRCALAELVEPTSKPPNDEARKVAMEIFRKLGNDLGAIGFVIEGSQIIAALKRAIITGMAFFLKQPQPAKVFKSVADMARWVRPLIHADEPAFEQRVVEAFQHLRQIMQAPGAESSS